MNDVVICEPLRTPVGRFGGVLKDIAPEDLAATVIRELVARTGITGIGRGRRDSRPGLPQR